ncbi:MAG: hypothetical protein KDC07_10285 [Chitinophagaceae bacterium]|nr:hypothetical protein [Chitinophagaceae bacterium]
MKKLLFFILGFLFGSGFTAIVTFTLYSQVGLKHNPYFILNADYNIEGAGILQKGTVIKMDAGMDEGFTRYILYLNLKGGDIQKVDTLKSDIIVPYWLNEK